MRTRVCLACRTLLGERESCGARGHQAVSLRDAAGRKRLWDEVWGPDSRARQLRQAAKAGAGGGLAGSLGNACTGCELSGLALDACSLAELGEGLVAVLVGLVVAAVVAVLAITVFWLIKAIVNAIRAWLDKPKPHGALLAQPKVPRVRSGRGRVKARGTVDLPWKSGSAVAYAFELHRKNVFGGGAMLRDAATGGFDVETADGRVVRIPAGRLRVVGKLARDQVDEARVGAFLGGVDPAAASGEDEPVFPYDEARAVVVAPGDEVEILGELGTSVDTTASHAYRASAGILVPVGLPVIRVLPRAGAGDAGPRARIAPDAEAEALEDEPASEQAGRRAGA